MSNMIRNEVQDQLQEIFRDVFDDESIELMDEMTGDDVEDWDSLSNITLIHEIEAAFNIRFTTKEIIASKNVGEFIDMIERKLS